MDAVYDSNLESVPLLHKGKVRDLYDLGDQHILMIASDRLSAFDVVFPNPIPDKGRVLTSLSKFWFDKTTMIVPNHTTNMVAADLLCMDKTAKPIPDVEPPTYPATYLVPELQDQPQLAARSMVVKKTKPLAIEAVVRGYLYGSAWREYQARGEVCGIRLDAGMQLGERLPDAIFTPTTKAEVGAHDAPITFEQVANSIGEGTAARVRDAALALYYFCRSYAETRGVIIADTKFEFGIDAEGNLVLIDEMLTPDSSRFWDLDSYKPGREPTSFDKQYVRNHLLQLGWDSTQPPPELPAEIINKSAEKYRQIEELLLNEN